MNIKITTFAVALIAGGLLAAAPAAIVYKDGKTQNAHNIDGQTVSGISWQSTRGKVEPRLRLWDVDVINYTGRGMDEFNGLPRSLAAGQGQRLLTNAGQVLKLEPVQGFNAADWELNVRQSAMYFLAQGYLLSGNYSEAAKAFVEYFKAAEKSPATQGILPLNYRSAATGGAVQNAGGLNRYYLDALEAYTQCLFLDGKAEDARSKGLKGLQDLCDELAAKSGDNTYHEWTMRALRRAALYAESKKDWAGARQAYEALIPVALKRGDNKPNRAAKEAQLKVGFMQIKAGDARGANARFIEAKTRWEAGHNHQRPQPPRADWLNADEAYMAAGSYLGLGLVKAHEAKTVADWSDALRNYSMSLSIFSADDEIRSMALLGAARACAELAELGKANETTASNHAKLGEKYLAELLNLMPKSRAAEDESVGGIQQKITRYKKGE